MYDFSKGVCYRFLLEQGGIIWFLSRFYGISRVHLRWYRGRSVSGRWLKKVCIKKKNPLQWTPLSMELSIGSHGKHRVSPVSVFSPWLVLFSRTCFLFFSSFHPSPWAATNKMSTRSQLTKDLNGNRPNAFLNAPLPALSSAALLLFTLNISPV